MFNIENDFCKIAINLKGAELDSMFYKANGLNYLWSGDPEFWAKKSPVLFPIVGGLKEDRYYFDGKAYQLPRHGFARDEEFMVVEQSATEIKLSLKSNTHTREKFPFDFNFVIHYSLHQNTLSVSYSVINEGSGLMYFSVGGHPAFKIPLVEGTNYEDYFLEFNALENAARWPVSSDGLIELEAIPLLENSNRLPLAKELFFQDALVFKHLSSNEVRLKSDKTSHGIAFDFTGFPYLGIWAAKNADFVCIEPWCGIADSINTNQQLAEKLGVHKLDKDGLFERTWKVTMF